MSNLYVDAKLREYETNASLLKKLEQYFTQKEDWVQPVYLINSPLGQTTEYSYQDGVVVVLIPGFKILFIDIKGQNDAFTKFFEDFVEDLGYLAEKFGYREKIGRPRTWRDGNLAMTNLTDVSSSNDIGTFLQKYRLTDKKEKRVGELLISLLVGSVNDIERVGIEEPENLIEKVRRNIILFDGDQTSFLYSNLKKKLISIQGLSGTGKTELLLHKLKDVYMKEQDSKIFFTCHNKALANELKNRIPTFFNFMKVDKQIDWNSRLWVDRAWGSQQDPNSGFYSYVCSFYKIPFQSWSYEINYSKIFNDALKLIESIPKKDFKYAFDYLFIDERQDFPDVFFRLCEKITKVKVYSAGDVFQNIFMTPNNKEQEFDIVLNRCYRTDPKTLMFGHAIALGLFEPEKLNWFTEKEWENLGYTYQDMSNGLIHLSRKPIRRFQDFNDEYISMIIERGSTTGENIVAIIKKIQTIFPTVSAENIAIIGLDNDRKLYNKFDSIHQKIVDELGWEVNRAYETKRQLPKMVYMTNSNNVKGLEFPFVICFSNEVQNDPHYRSTLYSMLTRSFIQSYFLVDSDKNLEQQTEGLQKINSNNYIETQKPTEEQLLAIKNKLASFKAPHSININEVLDEVLDNLGLVGQVDKAKLMKLLNSQILNIDSFNKDAVKDLVLSLKPFLQ
ncbi:MAG TPA: ATP-binding domain-containing protein [Sutterellaceae bacterium]|nr:ATP-binding domain-containing protein [Sutterellaceae bacterium]